MNLCKNIWLRLVMKSKPYLSTFTHIYPYTMMRIKTPAGFSIPTTPKSEKSEKAIDSDDHLFSENENASQTLDSTQLIFLASLLHQNIHHPKQLLQQVNYSVVWNYQNH